MLNTPMTLEESCRVVANAFPTALIMVTPDGSIMMANQHAEQLSGYRTGELIGEPVDHLVPDRHSASHASHRAKFIKSPEPRAMGLGRDLFLRRKDGTEVPVEIGLSPVVTVLGTVVLASIVDLSHRIQIRERLEDLAQRLSLATEAAGIGVWVYDLATQSLTWDERMLELYGLTPEEFSGAYEAWENGVHPDDITAARADVQAALGGNKGFHSEFRVVWPSGEVRHLEAHATVQHDPDGRPTQMIGVNLDITEKKQAEDLKQELYESIRLQAEELTVARDHALESDRLKSTFLATMSHELRTPLNSIIGFTGIVSSGMAGPLNTEQEKQLSMVQGSARHLLSLINDVLDISKIEAGQLEVDQAVFDAGPALKRCLEMVSAQAAKKSITLESQIDPRVGELVSDERRLEQIVLNLLSNAVKFTEQGEVVLRADVIDANKGSDGSGSPSLRVQVVDTGCGIAPADLEWVFHPFRQVGTGLDRAHEGTGLGLAICQRLAGLLGGEVSAQSVLGQGSTFELRLPTHPTRSA